MNHSHKNIPRSHNPSVHRKPQIDSFLPPEDYPNLCKHENLDQAFGVYGNLQLSLHGTSVLQLFVEEKPKPEPKPKNWVRVQVHFFLVFENSSLTSKTMTNFMENFTFLGTNRIYGQIDCCNGITPTICIPNCTDYSLSDQINI